MESGAAHKDRLALERLVELVAHLTALPPFEEAATALADARACIELSRRPRWHPRRIADALQGRRASPWAVAALASRLEILVRSPVSRLALPEASETDAPNYFDLHSPGASCLVPATEHRGMSLPQLRRIAAAARRRCVREGWTSTRPGCKDKMLTPKDITLYDLARHLIIPATRGTASGQRQRSLMELVSPEEQPPSWFVSHWWGERLTDFIACLAAHARDRGLSDERTFYWICAYANNQHDLRSEMPPDLTASSFYRALELPSVVGVLAVLDADGVVFSRVWCVFEMFMALVRGRAKLFDAYTVLPAAHGGRDAQSHPGEDEHGAEGEAVGLCDGYALVDENIVSGTYAECKAARERSFPRSLVQRALTFDARSADATDPLDKAAILAHVGEAGVDALNATVAASFGAAVRDELLARGPLSQLEAQLVLLSRSRLRKLAAVIENAPQSAPDVVSAPQTASGAPVELLRAPLGGVPPAAAHFDREAAARLLGDALPATLEELSLQGVDGAVLGGVSALLRRGGVQKLELIAIELAAERVEELARALCGAESVRALRMLALVHCGLPGAQLGGLIESVRELSQLRRLFLPSISLGAEGAAALAPGLQRMAHLFHLSVSGNAIGTAGALALAPALLRLAALEVLYLNDNAIGDDGATALAPGLGRMPALTQLFLHGNAIGDAGALALAAALRTPRALQLLNLSDNRLGDAGAAALVEAVRGCMALAEVHLAHNRLSDDGVRATLFALAHVRSVVVLPISIDILPAMATADGGLFEDDASAP